MSSTKKIWPRSKKAPLGPNPFYNAAKSPSMVPKFKAGEEVRVLRSVMVGLQSIMREDQWSAVTLDEIVQLLVINGLWIEDGKTLLTRGDELRAANKKRQKELAHATRVKLRSPSTFRG